MSHSLALSPPLSLSLCSPGDGSLNPSLRESTRESEKPEHAEHAEPSTCYIMSVIISRLSGDSMGRFWAVALWAGRGGLIRLKLRTLNPSSPNAKGACQLVAKHRDLSVKHVCPSRSFG